ncbi:MAG: OmpA family protein [Candidatus Rokubacteria bacterium]|nr:OmpA family protein [Candidatus Rokubacteria bacterium]
MSPLPRPGEPGAPGAPVALGPGAALLGAPAATRPPVPKEFGVIPEFKDIHFDFDRYDIRPGDAKILDENAKWVKANPNYLVLIEGHADERGTNEYNLALGRPAPKPR